MEARATSEDLLWKCLKARRRIQMSGKEVAQMLLQREGVWAGGGKMNKSDRMVEDNGFVLSR